MSRYGEPWKLSPLGGAVVSDTYNSDWHICHAPDDGCREAYGGWLLLESATPEICERIVLCVNALAGVSNETLRAYIARGGYAEAVSP